MAAWFQSCTLEWQDGDQQIQFPSPGKNTREPEGSGRGYESKEGFVGTESSVS